MRDAEEHRDAAQGAVALTDLLTRPCGTVETRREAEEQARRRCLVSETEENARDEEYMRRMSHNPATT